MSRRWNCAVVIAHGIFGTTVARVVLAFFANDVLLFNAASVRRRESQLNIFCRDSCHWDRSTVTSNYYRFLY